MSEIEFTLIRSARKTAAIHIKPNATVEVRAPLKMPEADINNFIFSKEKWIKTKLLQAQERFEKKSDFTLSFGDTVLFRGKACLVVPHTQNRVEYDGEHFVIPSNFESAQIKQACVQLYKILAKNVLTEKTVHFANLMKASPSAVKINSAKTRWGSCSSKKSLNFSWRLMMADDETIDYVVVHELAHISEMNHSARFWHIVANFLPDYKKRQTRLKSLQKRLVNEDWD